MSQQQTPTTEVSEGTLVKVEKLYRPARPKELKKSLLTNPYNNISNYSHEPTTVPPYVLYGIAHNETLHRSIKSKGSSNNNQDPFISSLNGNWATFLETVDTTPAYADGVLFRDVEALGELPDLNGKWGGDERLKHYMNNEGPLPKNKLYVKSSSDTDSSASERKEYIKRRSKAGYWMSTEKREEWIPYLKRILLYNNYVPLCFRILLINLSVIALALSCRIFHISTRRYYVTDTVTSEVSQQPSTIMAICVQAVALVYLGYIAYDEFKSKPLGIRNPVEKMRLILLDLLFIIFSSANLSLSFNTLYDSRWVCIVDVLSNVPKVDSICQLQQALCAFLFVILVMWVFTFSISIMRVIQKVSSQGDMS
jgi:hypothetical protein